MAVISRDWLPYQLPLKQVWQTSCGTLSKRNGELLRLKTDDGRIGWGDYAPLPDFGISEGAARQFAVETAYLDLAAQAAGTQLNSFLSDQAPVASATVNGNLGAIFNITKESCGAAIAQGYSVLKIKLGIGHWHDEVDYLQTLCRDLPAGIHLRLDANAAWSISDAEKFIAACAELPIEGLEEPLKNPSKETLRHLQQLAGFPLAIDESTHLINGNFFQQPAVQRLILKPARHGGLLPTLEIGLRAKAAGIECIVTSSLESVCGVLACAHLAMVIAPQSIHGLATGEWFSEDTGEPLMIRNGQLTLPTKAGLGFSFNEKTVSS
jgi:O-succinylbenzoate synthase